MLNNSLRSFTFNNTLMVRVVALSGEPWFVAADVCAALGLTNSRMSLRALDEDEKGVSSIDTLGGRQTLSTVSESGLYTLILRCRGATTAGTAPHRFRKWVTATVLPKIRKTGSYSARESTAAIALPTPRGGAGHSAAFGDLCALRDALAPVHSGSMTICENAIALIASYGSLVENARLLAGQTHRMLQIP